MPDLEFGLSNFDRDRGNFPKIYVVNMFAEEIPGEPSTALQSRPGLTNAGTTLATNPVTALYQVDGVLSGQMFAISGGRFYSGTTNLGAVDGTGPSKICGFKNRVFAGSGNNVFEYDGTTYSTVTLPSTFSVPSMTIGTDRLIIIDGGTGHFYWSDVLSDTIQPLSFATAEQSPDNLQEVLFVGDSLILFGSETVEFWPASSSNPNLPFTPLIGRTQPRGIRGTGCAAKFKDSFAWITNYNQVCVGNINTIISNAAIEEKISNSVSASLWTFRIEGTEFVAITLDTATYVFSSHTSTWSMFESYGYTNWVPVCYSNGIFGSGIDGQLITWGTDHSDFGGTLERRFRAGTPITTGSQPLYNLTIRTNPGETPYLTGDYSDPTVELRLSRDGGETWNNWREKSLGIAGHYRPDVMWSSLGFFGAPALLAEIRVTDPVPFRVSGVKINEQYGNF